MSVVGSALAVFVFAIGPRADSAAAQDSVSEQLTVVSY
jgi:hypothetical protein